MRYARRRPSNRLNAYDYRNAGAYFLTICTYRRALLFDHPPFAEIAAREWERSAMLRTGVDLDAFVVMPNHIHGIVWLIVDLVGAQRAAPSAAHGGARLGTPALARGSAGAFVRAYKSAVTRAINMVRGTPAAPVWQRNYYDHVVRDEDDLERIRQYIEENPPRWEFDRDNPRGRPDRVEREFWETRG